MDAMGSTPRGLTRLIWETGWTWVVIVRHKEWILKRSLVRATATNVRPIASTRHSRSSAPIQNQYNGSSLLRVWEVGTTSDGRCLSAHQILPSSSLILRGFLLSLLYVGHTILYPGEGGIHLPDDEYKNPTLCPADEWNLKNEPPKSSHPCPYRSS